MGSFFLSPRATFKSQWPLDLLPLEPHKSNKPEVWWFISMTKTENPQGYHNISKVLLLLPSFSSVWHLSWSLKSCDDHIISLLYLYFITVFESVGSFNQFRRAASIKGFFQALEHQLDFKRHRCPLILDTTQSELQPNQTWHKLEQRGRIKIEQKFGV